MKQLLLLTSLCLLMACAHQAPPNPALPPTDLSDLALVDLKGVGHAVVHSQPGKSPEQQRLLAIRAARIAALRDLAEQIYGARIEGDTTVTEAMVQNDQVRLSVEGLVRGASTVRINPVGDDSYEVVLKISGREVVRALQAARGRGV